MDTEAITDVLSDAVLVKRIQLGDQQAFNMLYQRYEKPLYNHVYRYLQNGEEAEEVFHDVLYKVLNFKDFQFVGDSLRGWLYLTAKNMSLNHLRKRQRTRKVKGIIENDSSELMNENQESEHIKREFQQKLLEISQALPESHQQVLELRMEGKNHKEISEELEIPEGTVKSRFHSITQFLRKGFSQ